MKTLNNARVIRDAKATEATFNLQLLTKIKECIACYIPEHELREINEVLGKLNRRHLTVEEIAMVAYVHCRSIKENKGASPYSRIMAYLAKHEVAVDKLQVKIATDVLLEIEFLTLIDGETKKGKCRVYELPKATTDVIY